MTPPHVAVDVVFDGLLAPLRVQQDEVPSVLLELLDQLVLGPVLHVVCEEDHMDASLGGLGHL